jgi:hypothetical protein
MSECFHKFASYNSNSVYDDCLINTSNVELANCQLKVGNASGIDGITSERILYSLPVISLHLLALFSAYIKRSHVPPALEVGITVSLLKGEEFDRYNIDDYRAIPLSPVLSKLLRTVFLNLAPFYGPLTCSLVLRKEQVVVILLINCFILFSTALRIALLRPLSPLTYLRHLIKLSTMLCLLSCWTQMFLYVL